MLVLILAVVAVVLLVLGALGVGGRVSLPLLAAACVVAAWLVVPHWGVLVD